MIDLGLARIHRLLQLAPQPTWRAIHVAGTNGKGSVCAHLSAMLHARGVSCGRFTSPHLVDRWDCIVVDERVVDRDAFRDAELTVLRRDSDASIGATEFELLTATALELFQRAHVSVAVIEAGLGGALDATTAMRADRLATVVTRIGLDHQSLLGNTLAAIGTQKAGIMRPGVPCIVDPANNCNRDNTNTDTDTDTGMDSMRLVQTLQEHARHIGAGPLLWADPKAILPSSFLSSELGRTLETHQLANLACAYAAFCLATGDEMSSSAPAAATDTAAEFLASVVRGVQWPGRLQRLDISPLLPPSPRPSASSTTPALLDGAHNPQSAEVLAAYVDKHLRPSSPGGHIVWVLAASHGKDLDSILGLLLRPGDRIAAVRFGPVDGMPWVQPTSPQSICDRAVALGVQPDHVRALPEYDGGASLTRALQWAADVCSASEHGSLPIVIAGSLYLVSDTLRLLREAGGETGLPQKSRG